MNDPLHYSLCFLRAELELSKDSAYIQEQQTAHAQKQSHRYWLLCISWLEKPEKGLCSLSCELFLMAWLIFNQNYHRIETFFSYMKILKVMHKIPPGNFSLAGIRSKIVFNGMTYYHTKYRVFITACGIFTPICSTIKSKELQIMDDLAPFKKLISFLCNLFCGIAYHCPTVLRKSNTAFDK